MTAVNSDNTQEINLKGWFIFYVEDFFLGNRQILGMIW